MARPKVDDELRRTVVRMVRLTQAEAAEIDEAVAVAGAGSVARWSRERLLEAARKTRT